MIFAIVRFFTILFFRQLGLIGYYLSRKRKKVVLSNLTLCFGALQKQNNKIAKESYISLGHAMADFILLKRYSAKNIDKYIAFKNLNYLQEALSLGRGVIICSGHFGSWELAAHALALKGYKSLILYNPIKKPAWLEKAVIKRREVGGNQLISKRAALGKVGRWLRRGGVATLLVDQNCKPVDGVRIPLLGQDVWTNISCAQLSLRLGAPIVPGFIFTKGLGGYELYIGKPLYPEEFKSLEDPAKSIATAFYGELEGAITKSSGEWMWQHRRFKNLS